jgi:hypothetical protein
VPQIAQIFPSQFCQTKELLNHLWVLCTYVVLLLEILAQIYQASGSFLVTRPTSSSLGIQF